MKKRAAGLPAVQGANKNRKEGVRNGTPTAARSYQRSNVGKSSSGVASSAGKQADASRRPFAVFDIDGTLVRWQLYHAIADELVKLGYIDRRDFKAVKEARMEWKKRSGPEAFKIYERRLITAYEKMLLSLPVGHFNEAVESVFAQYQDQVYTYTRELTQKLKKKGYLLFAISNSQIEIVAKIAQYYGFDSAVGTYYVNNGKRFTGAATIPLGDKHLVLADLARKNRASYKGSIAVGDSSTDINMLEAVEIPIAFNPEKKLFEHAKAKGWQIVVERKNVVYELGPKDGRYVLV